MFRTLIALMALLSVSQGAFAYLDPGTGSMVLQGVIAAIAVVGFTIKSYWYKIRAFFGKGGSASLLDDDEEGQRPE
ncbi:MAG: hypothetical protein GY922_18680 [Proteobacteria bacterium]|nr:hypothetical protein [Pseudomonadota bacterium]